jgi:hypothetical protein
MFHSTKVLQVKMEGDLVDDGLNDVAIIKLKT